MTELPRHDDTRILRISLIAALLIHAALLLSVTFSPAEIQAKPITPEHGPVITTAHLPPPPRRERATGPKAEFERRMPVPFDEPEEFLPIEEVDPEVAEDPIEGSFEELLGTPEAPPSSGPHVPGIDGVTAPVLIASSKVRPRYPEIAVVSRSQGRVTLQAVIREDGTVAEVQVLGCDKPGVGFEEAATAAVLTWRYEPARRNGRPVEVYFKVRVDFALQ